MNIKIFFVAILSAIFLTNCFPGGNENSTTIPAGEIGADSRSVELQAVGEEIQPGYYVVDPLKIQGKKLIIPETMAKTSICIGVYSKKKERCIGIYIERKK